MIVNYPKGHPKEYEAEITALREEIALADSICQEIVAQRRLSTRFFLSYYLGWTPEMITENEHMLAEELLNMNIQKNALLPEG